ncbi:hypothetical protein AAFC00_002965 [Neodothiora populina]|uniref:Protein PBN1 n=1 Tax=Neodothiora populina TaxID=2781224 RepID=A0ABR3P947_9PEZI
MKQRITYLLKNAHEQGGVDPATLEVSKDSLKIPGLNGAKEWRITVGAKELPQEIWQVLKLSHELHIRWTSATPYDAISPLVSRTPPGLHVFFTPRKDASQDVLCPLLTNVFGRGISCHSVKESFSTPPILSERFAMSASHQYYQSLPDLHDLIVYLQHKVCSAENTVCKDQIAQLSKAASLDLDYDTISHALQITTTWARSPVGPTWSEVIRLRSKSDSVEVGVLNPEKPTEPEELSLGGFLTVLGEDDKPSATLFSFPARHHPLPIEDTTAFKTSFQQPSGLHPTLQLSFREESLKPPSPSCSLHTYLTLPSTVFLDRYQLSDPLFLASNNLLSLRSLSGESDLEAPAWVIKKWGSASLFELKSPRDYYDDDLSASASTEDQNKAGDWNVTIPLHLRYLDPSGGENMTSTSQPGKRTTKIPWPAVFWACEAEEGLKMGVNPFDRVNLGYDGLFGPKTMFYHVPPARVGGEHGELYEKLEAPVLDLQKSRYVEAGSAFVVVMGFAWVAWVLLRGTFGRKVDEGKKKI